MGKEKDDMRWLTKLLPLQKDACRSWSVAVVLGIVGMCFGTPALAGSVVEADVLAWIGDHAETVTDAELSAIQGKGETATGLNGNDQLAVILWDERGSGNPRVANHENDGGQSFQNVNLTVNRR